MSQADSQIGSGQSGTAYRTADNAGKKAILSHHKASSAPSYAEAGILWLDDTATPWIAKWYDGADWIVMGYLNASTNVWTAVQDSNHCVTVGGTANAITLTPPVALAAYGANLGPRSFIVTNANTSGTVTIATSGLATRNLKKFVGGAVCALAVGDLIVGMPALIFDDGTQCVLLNPATYTHGADIASASTLNLDTATGDYVYVTGTTGVTAITLAEGRERTTKFSGIVTITAGGSLVPPGGVSYTTTAGDVIVWRGEASGVVRAVGCLPVGGNAAKAVAQSFSGAQRASLSLLTDGATITPDFSLNNNYQVTLGGNRTLANPTNCVAGQSGCIDIWQDSTGSRTLAYAWGWQFAGGTAPTATATACAKDALYYDVKVAQSAVVTMTIATPGVVTYTGHGLVTGQKVQLTTTGALPTGLTASTTYYVIVNDANSFWLATSLVNAAAGTKIATSGSQSGTHTATAITISANLVKAIA